MTASVIYADPPWHFKTYSAKGRGRTADAWYDTMSMEDIIALPVLERASPDCTLLLWTIDPFLEAAFRVIKAWGFKYKIVGFYWVKVNKDGMTPFKGLGHWTRSNPEQCLLATRGHPKRLSANVDKLIISQRREHSRKLLGGPYLELFARSSPRPGWTAWGNEVGKLDDGNAAPERRWHADMRELKDDTE